jgi:2-polyprenyl-3-methyl-5-hydroxy-6-metoxy-1,4-benzoquinol methylase
MNYIVERTKQHKEDSLIHDQNFLNWWGNAHLFGTYPTRKINPREIPEMIYQHLGVDFEEIYSGQEQIEMKHPIMVRQWYEYFRPSSVLDVGCGRGAYLYFWNWFTVGRGIEINKWAVKNAFTHDIKQGDITDRDTMEIPHSDYCELTDQHFLITAIDVLEHLNDEQLDKALNNITEFGLNFLFSIPFIGDPNLEADKTHKQFKTKDEWIRLIESHGIKLKETPKEWLFSNQILIGTK